MPAASPREIPPAAAPRPRRHGVVMLNFLVCMIAYTDRVNISVAAVAMREQLGWSQTDKGFVLSAFFVGYLLCMFASGIVARRYGGRLVLGLSLLAWSVFTLLTPWAAGVSFAALIAVRVLMGAGEAAVFPAIYELLARWVPAGERSRAAARVLSGIPLGTVLGLLLTGWLVSRFGWPMAFHFFGILGLLLAGVWFRRVRSDPREDPRVGPAELALLDAPRGAAESAPVPWRRLLLHRAVLAVVAANFATTWVLYMLISWLPSYFREVQGLDISSAGLFSAAPWISMAIASNLAAVLADRLLRGGTSLTRVRIGMQAVGLLGPALCLLLLQGVATPGAALALVCLATAGLGCTWSGYAPAAFDLAPRHASVLSGYTNSFAQIPGIVGVALTGWTVDATGTYAAAFVLAAAVATAGTLAFALFFEARPILADAG